MKASNAKEVAQYPVDSTVWCDSGTVFSHTRENPVGCSIETRSRRSCSFLGLLAIVPTYRSPTDLPYSLIDRKLLFCSLSIANYYSYFTFLIDHQLAYRTHPSITIWSTVTLTYRAHRAGRAGWSRCALQGVDARRTAEWPTGTRWNHAPANSFTWGWAKSSR